MKVSTKITEFLAGAEVVDVRETQYDNTYWVTVDVGAFNVGLMVEVGDARVERSGTLVSDGCVD